MRKFFKELKKMRGVIPVNTIRTLRGQALSGDLNGARKGLETWHKRGVDKNDYSISKQQN